MTEDEENERVRKTKGEQTESGVYFDQPASAGRSRRPKWTPGSFRSFVLPQTLIE